MKIFLDSAHIREIEEAYETGIVNGVTTNPSLIKQALSEKKKGKKIDLSDYIQDILSTARGTPVSLEVTETETQAMVDEALSLYNRFNPIANNVYIKIPVNSSLKGKNRPFDSLKAIRALVQSNVPINATLVFTPEQALLAAKAGARIVSIFAGRMDDYIRLQHGIGFEKTDYFPAEGTKKGDMHVQDNGIVSGIDLVAKCSQILRSYNLKSEVLAASIRNTRQLREAALAGAHIATIPLDVLKLSIAHPKTVEGLTQFLEDVPNEYKKLRK
jgi:transaldolase